MSATEFPVDQCDCDDKDSLRRSREERLIWDRWLNTDPNHAIWKQIFSMLLQDLTFRALAAAADADPASALHSPIVRSGVVLGYAATQGLAIRRLVDMTKGVISLRRLNMQLRKSRGLLTREIFVSGYGVPYDSDAAYRRSFSDTPKAAPLTISWAPAVGPTAFIPSMALHDRFDHLSGVSPEHRARGDRIQKRVFDRIESWLTAPEISAVKAWSDNTLAHASDQPADLASLAPTFNVIASAHRDLVRAAIAISTFILHGPALGEIVPIPQYNQYERLEKVVSDSAIQVARETWRDLADERNQWKRDVFDALVA